MQIEKFDQTELLTELKKSFDLKEIEELSKASKFVRRKTAKLRGLPFLMMNVFDTTDGKERSLNDSCDWLAEHFDIEISKQSLDERYNKNSVEFIKLCFNRVLQIVNSGSVDRSLNIPFSKIQLTDATSFRIPDHLANHYKGWEGQGGAAILKMHFYFLSRAKSSCTYSIKDEDGEFQKVDIADYLPKAGQIKEVEEIYVGCKKHKAKVRLILEAVPEEVAQQRLKQLDRYASKHPKANVSEQRKAMCYFNVFITNAPADKLPASLIRMVYTIRWQIELLFKIWKSIFKIDEVKKMSIYRFECYIYSKLIAILLTLHIHNKLGQFLWDEEEFELSPMKAAKLIKKRFGGLKDALLTSKKRLIKWFDQTANLLIKRAKKHVRKLKGKSPKLTPWQIIELLA